MHVVLQMSAPLKENQPIRSTMINLAYIIVQIQESESSSSESLTSLQAKKEGGSISMGKYDNEFKYIYYNKIESCINHELFINL